MMMSLKDREVDWATWEPDLHATLMFVVRGDEVLLIEKLTGIGQGKINGPGGKIDPGETAEEGVIRECQEELCISVKDPVKMGELWFDMSDIPNIHCHVYIAEAFDGEPTSTREANPFWCDQSEIPYKKMWADDAYWLPQMLSGKKFDGKFIFEKEEIIWNDVHFEDSVESLWRGYSVR